MLSNASDKVVDLHYYKYCRQDINEEILPATTYNVFNEPVDTKSMLFRSVFDVKGASLPDVDKGGANMDWQEKYIDKVDKEISDIKSEIRNLEANITNNISTQFELFRSEMRHIDNQRVDDMREIRSSLESTNKHVQSMVSSVHSIAIATVIGVAAMVISVFGIWYSIAK